jgi:hypothetical protein
MNIFQIKAEPWFSIIATMGAWFKAMNALKRAQPSFRPDHFVFVRLAIQYTVCIAACSAVV